MGNRRFHSAGFKCNMVRFPLFLEYFVLKALAFENRREGKDAHYLGYVLRYGGATANLADEITADERESAAFRHAVETLRRNFGSPADDGPVRYSRFLRDAPDSANQAFAAVQEFLQTL